MSKIKISSNLISNDENLNIETNGIKRDNIIIYKEDQICVTISVFNNKIKMKRVHPDYIVELIFEKNKETLSNYWFVGGSKNFKLSTKTKKLIVTDKEIEIEYILEDNSFKYKLELEEL